MAKIKVATLVHLGLTLCRDDHYNKNWRPHQHIEKSTRDFDLEFSHHRPNLSSCQVELSGELFPENTENPLKPLALGEPHLLEQAHPQRR